MKNKKDYPIIEPLKNENDLSYKLYQYQVILEVNNGLITKQILFLLEEYDLQFIDTYFRRAIDSIKDDIIKSFFEEKI